jgi:hypothetical protein
MEKMWQPNALCDPGLNAGLTEDIIGKDSKNCKVVRELDGNIDKVHIGVMNENYLAFRICILKY